MRIAAITAVNRLVACLQILRALQSKNGVDLEGTQNPLLSLSFGSTAVTSNVGTAEPAPAAMALMPRLAEPPLARVVTEGVAAALTRLVCAESGRAEAPLAEAALVAAPAVGNPAQAEVALEEPASVAAALAAAALVRLIVSALTGGTNSSCLFA